MKKRVAGTVLMLALMANAVIAEPANAGKPQKQFKGPVKVFILAGQSNMQGYGHTNTTDALGLDPKYGHLLKKIKNPDGSFVVRDDVFYRRRGVVPSWSTNLMRDWHCPLTAGCGANNDTHIGPELMFGITMGDYYEEPVLLIKAAWGGKSLFRDFRPPSAGKPAYEVAGRKGTPVDFGGNYRQMVQEVHECLDNMDTQFPQLKGLKYEICGFVWFQGWNDMCSGKKEIHDEYCSNFVHLVHDLRAEFKVPELPVVLGELGCGGEDDDPNSNMSRFRAAQAKIATCPELKGRVGYVRTAPFWYPELNELPKLLKKEADRVKQGVDEKFKEEYKAVSAPAAKDVKVDEAAKKEMAEKRAAVRKELDEKKKEALEKALAADEQYQKVKKQHGLHISNEGFHYAGSVRVYSIVGYSLASALKPLLEKK